MILRISPTNSFIVRVGLVGIIITAQRFAHGEFKGMKCEPFIDKFTS